MSAHLFHCRMIKKPLRICIRCRVNEQMKISRLNPMLVRGSRVLAMIDEIKLRGFHSRCVHVGLFPWMSEPTFSSHVMFTYGSVIMYSWFHRFILFTYSWIVLLVWFGWLKIIGMNVYVYLTVWFRMYFWLMHDLVWINWWFLFSLIIMQSVELFRIDGCATFNCVLIITRSIDLYIHSTSLGMTISFEKPAIGYLIGVSINLLKKRKLWMYR